MRILLTGMSGFVARNVYMSLRDYGEIYPVDGRLNLLESSNCDRTLQDSRADVVVHVAGRVGGIKANSENPGKFFYENMKMGMNMIEASRRAAVDKFIMLGTVCAYPKHTPVPFKEEDIWNGYPEETNAPYGIAKKALMEMICAYNKQYNFPGVNLVPVNMYGMWDHFNLDGSHVIPALILKINQAIEEGKKSIEVWGTGNATREFLFAQDCGDAIVAAVQSDVGPEPINIGTGVETKISELVDTICDIMGFDGEIIYNDSKLEGQPRRCLDVSKAKELLGFEAKTSLRDGLQQTIDWFQRTIEEHKNKGDTQ